MKRLALALALLALSTIWVSDAAAQTPDIKSINAYCKTVDAITKKRKGPDVIFADISDYTSSEKAKWKKFKSEKVLEKFRERSETYTIAYVWRGGGRVVASNFTAFSPSGDWTKYIYSYFRTDGTLARVDVDYRTFHGDIIVLQNLYFNKAGKLLKESTTFRDLATNKPKQATPENVELGSRLLSEVDYYKSTKKLPFAHLLSKK